MKTNYISILFALIFGIFLPMSLRAQDTDLIIIRNEVSVPSEMDLSQLKSVLRGEKYRWKDGSKVVVALMKTNTPVGTNTCRKLYNMSSNELNKYFLALVFQGKVKAPTFFNSESELASFVAETPGAIGVLQNVYEIPVKTILVDGKKQI